MDLAARTKRFTVDVFRFCNQLPKGASSWVVRSQLMRCASSVGANYRAACHARSRAEFVAKLGLVEEEADECQFWIEILAELELGPDRLRNALHREAQEITRMVVASIKTARGHRA
jgi:four helix bundle protein